MKKILISDLEKSFGIKKNFFSKEFYKIYKKVNLKYFNINKKEEKKLISSIVNKIIQDKKDISSTKRKKIWHKGWEQNYKLFKKNPKDLKHLFPQYLKKSPLRFFRKFIKPQSKYFEYNFFQLLRQSLIDKYLIKYNNIYEFGSGTGLTVLSLSKNFPNKKIFASDFVKSSINIIDLIKQHYKLNIESSIFDIKKPNYNLDIKDNSAVITFGAIEQVGTNYKQFVNYLLKKKPNLIINMEPFKETYDLKNYMDLLSYFFVHKRKYAEDFLPYLKKLEKLRIIKIIKFQRTYFGGKMMESYNYIVWKVL